SIDINSMAIGETVTSQHAAVRNVVKRISATEMESEQFRNSDGALLMKARFTIEGNDNFLIYYDRNFWNVTLDGQPFDGPPPKFALAGIDGNHEDKKLTLTSITS